MQILSLLLLGYFLLLQLPLAGMKLATYTIPASQLAISLWV